VLNLKPILGLEDGQIEAVERVRTMNKSIDRLLELVDVKLSNEPGPVRLCAIHGNAFEEANLLLNKAIKKFSSSLVRETLISDISPVLGTHTGPGALGLAYMIGM
jgi:fatty acid-binding protein DegV